MSRKEDDAERHAVLLRMLKTPPKPLAPLGRKKVAKPKPSRHSHGICDAAFGERVGR